MVSWSILFLTSIYILLIFAKKNYIIEIEKGELVYYNSDFGRNVQFGYTRFNKTTISVYASFDVDSDRFGSDAAISADVFRYVGNQWREIPVVKGVSLNLCDIFKKNQFIEGIRELLQHGNVTPCDVKAGHYYLKDFVPNLDFPPLVPGARYLAKAYIKQKDLKLFQMDWTATLIRNK